MNLKMWNKQKDFEKIFFKFKGLDFDSLTLDEKKQWSKEFFSHTVVELSEMLTQCKYKMHRQQTDTVNEYNIKNNLIDATKFLLGLSQLWFSDFDEFEKMFNDKSAIVEKRFEFEQMHKINESDDNIVILDIDDVLADHEEIMYNMCINETARHNYAGLNKDELKQKYTNTREFKADRPVLYEDYKHIFRSTFGSHERMKPNKGAIKFCKELKSLGFKIVVITARPLKQYSNIWIETANWLNKHKIEFDALYFDTKKHDTILDFFKDRDKIKFIVDDNTQICKQFDELGIKTYNFDNKIITFDSILNEIKG